MCGIAMSGDVIVLYALSCVASLYMKDSCLRLQGSEAGVATPTRSLCRADLECARVAGQLRAAMHTGHSAKTPARTVQVAAMEAAVSWAAAEVDGHLLSVLRHVRHLFIIVAASCSVLHICKQLSTQVAACAARQHMAQVTN